MHIDMPLEQLKKYMGKSIKPNDFDIYWEKGLREVRNLSTEYELIPASIKSDVADCYHLYFTGTGNATIHAKFVRPKQVKPESPGLVMFHGYSVDSGDWLDKLPYAAQGITVLAMDCRGQGGDSEDTLTIKGPTLRGHVIRGIEDPNPNQLYYRHVFLDTVQSVRVLQSMEHIHASRIGACGASQGGGLALACAALVPEIKEVAAVYPFLSDYRRVWEDMDIQQSAYEEIATYFRTRDPNHDHEDEVFQRLGYIDIQHLTPRIKGHVWWALAMKDMICPPSTQFAAYNKISASKDMLLFHEYGHEHLPSVADLMFQQMSRL
ncbi:alpha/beta fold hydrolase [Bacillus changyiensis]|uniref:alpha/beta fold hydrolase n=1 Tax=Bacillus changyiensis TaxID=3004103 RepID=UPI0022E899B6|nr:alpha/beta fold hydrolase [Bacillus changyiensis]MDA1477383.1 alpha/beta fold hydrolase [Bacillus changyiensis]